MFRILQHQLQAALDFAENLFFRAEYVRVVLRKTAYPGHSAEFARLLPAIDGPELRQPDREVSIGMLTRCIDLDVHRAIHRLQQVTLNVPFPEPIRKVGARAAFFGEPGQSFRFDKRRKLRIAIVGIMARSAEESQFPDVGREDLGISLSSQLFRNKGLKFLSDDCAFRFPEHQSGSDLFVDMKQLKFATELTMVAFFGLFELAQNIGRAPPVF